MAVLMKYKLATPNFNDSVIRNVWECYDEYENDTDEKKIAKFINHSYIWYNPYTLYKLLLRINKATQNGGCLRYKLHNSWGSEEITEYVNVEKLGQVYSELINEADAQLEKLYRGSSFRSGDSSVVEETRRGTSTASVIEGARVIIPSSDSWMPEFWER